MIISILCIVFYIKEVENISIHTYMEKVVVNIYTSFLINDGKYTDGQIINARIFAGFMWTYLFLDLIWVLVSFYVLGKKQKREKLALRLWSLATSVICLLDLILSILLGIDYQNCFNDASRVVFAELASEQVCANIILPVLIIAAKGFTLWIVNVIFAFILFRISTQLPDKQQDSASKKMQSLFIPSSQFYSEGEYSSSLQILQAYNEFPVIQRRSQLEEPCVLRSPLKLF
ncbi:uncharacterized protein LOC135128338 isoform X2 [Zophobas morio]